MQDTNQIGVNLIPFFAAALAHAPNIKEDIVSLYSKKPEEYYMAAKNSEFYECKMCKENSLLTEELFKKCLGFLCYAGNSHDEETLIGIYDLFKKAYRKTYRFFKNKNEEDISYADYQNDMAAYLERLNSDAYFDNMAAFLYYSKGLCKGMDIIVRQMAVLWEHYISQQNRYDKYIKEHEKEINEVYKGLSSDVLNMILSPEDKDDTGLNIIYESEKLNPTSLFNELQFNEKDKQGVIVSYLKEKEYGRKCDFETYFLFAFHLKAMCKAYNKGKEMYFENNKETMYVEMGALEKELHKSEAARKSQEVKIKQLSESESERNQKLLQENAQLQKQIKRLQNTISQMESDSKEVVALRNYVFNLDSMEPENDTDSEDVVDFAVLDNLKGIVIGGFPSWQNKLKDKLHSWKFINAGVNELDCNLLLNADVVVFCIKCLNHTLYYKVMNTVRNSNVQIGYINNDNVLKSLEAIYKAVSAKAA